MSRQEFLRRQVLAHMRGQLVDVVQGLGGMDLGRHHLVTDEELLLTCLTRVAVEVVVLRARVAALEQKL